MDQPVGRRVVPSLNEYGVALCNRETEHICRIFLDVRLYEWRWLALRTSPEVGLETRRDTYTVGFDDAHVVTVDPEVECGECGRVDNSQPIGTTWNKG